MKGRKMDGKKITGVDRGDLRDVLTAILQDDIRSINPVVAYWTEGTRIRLQITSALYEPDEYVHLSFIENMIIGDSSLDDLEALIDEAHSDRILIDELSEVSNI